MILLVSSRGRSIVLENLGLWGRGGQAERNRCTRNGELSELLTSCYRRRGRAGSCRSRTTTDLIDQDVRQIRRISPSTPVHR